MADLEAEALQEQADVRAQFLDLISAYSEDNWCAGWYSGVEDIIRKDGGIWLACAQMAGGWPKGYRAENGWEPLTVEEEARLPRVVLLGRAT